MGISTAHFGSLFSMSRTYVRGPEGPGIYFIREWINNPLSRLARSRSYGLPYHCMPMRRGSSRRYNADRSRVVLLALTAKR